jgi:hypothetical protein
MNKDLSELKIKPPLKAVQEESHISPLIWYVTDADDVKWGIFNETSAKAFVAAFELAQKFLDNIKDCGTCLGQGIVRGHECPSCYGSGTRIVSRGVLMVELPNEARELLGAQL